MIIIVKKLPDYTLMSGKKMAQYMAQFEDTPFIDVGETPEEAIGKLIINNTAVALVTLIIKV